MSERVYRLAGGEFDYENLGELNLKGIAAPTRAYRVVGVSAAVSRFDAAVRETMSPLVGRAHEMEVLLAHWQSVRDQRTGQAVLLSGEPGFGKSCIASALLERLKAEGARSLRFQCSPFYVNSAFYPIIANFERLLKFGRDELPDSKLDKLEALVVRDYGLPLGDVRLVAAMLSVPHEQRYGSARPDAPAREGRDHPRAGGYSEGGGAFAAVPVGVRGYALGRPDNAGSVGRPH